MTKFKQGDRVNLCWSDYNPMTVVAPEPDLSGYIVLIDCDFVQYFVWPEDCTLITEES